MSEPEQSCIFCKIANGNDPSTKLYFQDENFAVFSDIRPAAEHHYLVVPRQHIANVSFLGVDQEELVDRLTQIGRQVLLEQGGNESDVRCGFHRPPFTSVSHLHLHVIAPATTMGFLQRLIFRPNTWWFTTVDLPKIANSEPLS